jgi:hypothetical protein
LSQVTVTVTVATVTVTVTVAAVAVTVTALTQPTDVANVKQSEEQVDEVQIDGEGGEDIFLGVDGVLQIIMLIFSQL